MRRALLVVAALLVALAIGLYAALPRLTSSETARELIVGATRSLAAIDLDIGSLRVGYDLRLQVADLRAAWADGEPFARIASLDLSPPWIRPGLDAYTLGAIRIDGAELDFDRMTAAGERPQAVDQADAHDRDGRPVALSSVQLDDLYVRATFAGDVERFGPIRAKLRGRANGGAGRSLDVSFEATIDPKLPPLHARGTLSAALDDEAEAELDVTWSGAALSELLRYARIDADSSGLLDARLRLHATHGGVDVSIAADGVTVRDLALSAGGAAAAAKRATIGGSANVTSAGDLATDLELTVENASANDADYRRVADGLGAHARVTWKRSHDGRSRADCSAAIASGEALWDRFWVDLGRFAPTFSARLEADADGYRFDDGRLNLRGLADWAGEAVVDRKQGHSSISGRLQIHDLATLLDVAVKEPFKESYPALADARAGGRLAADFALVRSGASGFSLHGRAKLRDASLLWRQPSIALGGVEIDLPLALGTTGVRDGRLVGRLATQSVELMGSSLGGFDTPITVGANTLRVDEAVRLDLFGGTLTLEELSAKRLLDGAQVRAGLNLAGLELADLTRTLELPALQGTAAGRLGPIIYENGVIACRGGIQLETLGGTIELGGLGASGLFSPVPALELDARFHDVSLAALTEAVEVGRVSGVIGGQVDDLVLVRGQPVSMKARVATSRKSGVRQTISVKALDQISILGGSESNALSRGIVGLFDRYRYEKMGFACSLENDRFTLRGIERSGGKDLLVVGSWLPPTVNVVSHSQVIAFSEMVRRLARIRDAGAPGAEEPSGPKEHSIR